METRQAGELADHTQWFYCGSNSIRASVSLAGGGMWWQEGGGKLRETISDGVKFSTMLRDVQNLPELFIIFFFVTVMKI